MTLETISAAPTSDSFVPISAHESRTPEAFFGGKPVLHYVDEHARLIIPQRQSHHLLIFDGQGRPFDGQGRPSDHDDKYSDERRSSGRTVNGHVGFEGEDEEAEFTDIAIWVTSEKVILYNPSNTAGVAISYSAIILHAIQRLRVPGVDQSDPQGEEHVLYMQISIPRIMPDPLDEDASEVDDGDYDDDDGGEVIDVKIIPSRIHLDSPPSFSKGQSQAGEADTMTTATALTLSLSNPQSPIRSLFAAISTCSNLHPDPSDQHDHLQQAFGANNDIHVIDADDPVVFEGSVGYVSVASPSSRGPYLAPGSGSASAGLPAPMPGSGGWITADNVDDFFDSQGNWRGRNVDDQTGPTAAAGRARGDHRPGIEAGLGTGAGLVGTRAHADDHDENMNKLEAEVHVHHNDDDGEPAQSKAVDENEDGDGPPISTKWRRTG